MGNMCSNEAKDGQATANVAGQKGGSLSNVDFSQTSVALAFNLNDAHRKAITDFGFFNPSTIANLVEESESVFEQGNLSTGNRYYGLTKNKQPHGRGFLQTTEGDLIGCSFKDGVPQGQGVIYFANGNYFVGEVGQTGPVKGKLHLTNGDVQEGFFEGQKPNGDIHIRYKDGREYKGKMLNGERHGYGVFNWLDGSKYEGNWKKVQHGQGKFTDAQGQVKDGQFYEGKFVSA